MVKTACRKRNNRGNGSATPIGGGGGGGVAVHLAELTVDSCLYYHCKFWIHSLCAETAVRRDTSPNTPF